MSALLFARNDVAIVFEFEIEVFRIDGDEPKTVPDLVTAPLARLGVKVGQGASTGSHRNDPIMTPMAKPIATTTA